MIPDYTYSAASCVCYSDFPSSSVPTGAFRASLNFAASVVGAAIGGRLAKV
jgi:hypothetical protein